MCGPNVMAYVQERLGRRDFFRAGTVGAVGAAATTLVAPTAARADTEAAMSISIANIRDLTHVLDGDFPVFPGFERMQIRELFNVAEHGFYVNEWTIGEHTGTHIDAPAHFVDGARTIDQVDPGRLIAPAAVIDISDRAAEDPDAAVTVDDIRAWEDAHGSLPDGAAVLMLSGWESRLGREGDYLNADDEGALSFPGFSPEAAEFLINERSISGVGVDTLSIDVGRSSTFDVHLTVLGANRWGLENLANLADIPAAGAHIIIGALPVRGASGGPVRVLAGWA